MSFQRFFIYALIAIFCQTLAFSAGFFLHTWLAPTSPTFPVLEQAHEILVSNGLKDVPQAPAIEYGMIRGMLEAYDDPYTVFVEPVQHELATNTLQGSFGGIGIQVERDEHGHILLFPIPVGAADRAGILQGDRLLAVDEFSVSPETSIDAVQAAIRGPEGTNVTLKIARATQFDPLEFTIRRESIPLPSVTWRLYPDEPQLGVIKVNIVANSTPDEIQKAAKDLQTQGATHFVLDLRNNGGGLLQTGIEIARLFLREGVIVQQQYRGQKVETLRIESPGPLANLPLVILVNHGTASAAEIIAGALQAQNRAILVGAPTFGKDTIQFVFDLQDGSSLHVTAGQWWIPDLDPPLPGNGLQPDVSLPADTSGSDAAITAAIQELFNR
jgi:carboxyl-terminal processing protease